MMELDHTYFFDQARGGSCRQPLITFISMASRFGDVETLQKLLHKAVASEGPSFLTSPTIGLALNRAIPGGHIDVIRCLVDAGADINSKFKCSTAVHEAIRVNNTDILRYLLTVPGLDCNALNVSQKTPVMEAASRGRVECLTMLLDHGCSTEGENLRRKTALHYCLVPWLGFVEVEDIVTCMDLVYKAGADINAQDWFGTTPLHLAISTENFEAVVWLLRHNCKLDLESRPPDLSPGVFSCLGQITMTPLVLAIHFANRRVVELLVRAGARCHQLSWVLPYCQPYRLLHQFISQCLTSPSTLHSLCRRAVRCMLQSDVEVKVNRLTCLPESVQRYLLLTEELREA